VAADAGAVFGRRWFMAVAFAGRPQPATTSPRVIRRSVERRVRFGDMAA